MRLLALIPGILIIVVVLVDVFEVIVLPRRVERRFRPARFFYRGTWRVWRGIARRLSDHAREPLLGLYGPLALLGLIATWAGALVLGYALLYWADGNVAGPPTHPGFLQDLYYSGTSFFTLGLGDIAPLSGGSRTITVLEVANGFAFLALVIGYLPIFYQAFSRRESVMALLDARAGSPPTAGELLRRVGDDEEELRASLREYEHWAADLLESHLSYAVLMFFRSQHEHQSWVATLTAILDASAIVVVRGDDRNAAAAQRTFAIARHAAVDLAGVFERAPAVPDEDRLADDYDRLNAVLAAAPFLRGDALGLELEGMRVTYEPYVDSLSRYLLMPLPPWVPSGDVIDDWQTSPVDERAFGLADPIPERKLREPRT